MKKKKEKKVASKYKLVVYNETSLQELFNFKLSRANIFTYFGFFTIILIFLVILLFIFTPLNSFLPRYHDVALREQIEQNRINLDSLQEEIFIRDIYFENIKNIAEGKELKSIDDAIDSTFKNPDETEFTKTKHDSILKELIEKEEELYLSMVDDDVTAEGINKMNFYKPVDGMISAKFDRTVEHYAIDLVAKKDAPILSTLSGTVILATWSNETGYVIQVQHDNNLISIYKHCSKLLKKEGERVNAGQPIAIIGNSGELSTGPHLHFELWHNGTPINPADYIAY